METLLCKNVVNFVINVKRSWSSGVNDAQILAKAQEVYRKEKKKTLKNLAFWNVAKDKEN